MPESVKEAGVRFREEILPAHDPSHGTPHPVVRRRLDFDLPQGEAHTPVILGEEGDEPLLGVVTLEILGLVLNPFNRTLQPMKMYLA